MEKPEKTNINRLAVAASLNGTEKASKIGTKNSPPPFPNMDKKLVIPNIIIERIKIVK